MPEKLSDNDRVVNTGEHSESNASLHSSKVSSKPNQHCPKFSASYAKFFQLGSLFSENTVVISGVPEACQQISKAGPSQAASLASTRKQLDLSTPAQHCPNRASAPVDHIQSNTAKDSATTRRLEEGESKRMRATAAVLAFGPLSMRTLPTMPDPHNPGSEVPYITEAQKGLAFGSDPIQWWTIGYPRLWMKMDPRVMTRFHASTTSLSHCFTLSFAYLYFMIQSNAWMNTLYEFLQESKAWSSHTCRYGRQLMLASKRMWTWLVIVNIL